jgi:chondroitin 4-sulfotransferase 11
MKFINKTVSKKIFLFQSFSQLNNALNNSISFIIVRHPFERLLSAYNDKLKFALPHTFHQKLGNMIVRKFRKAVSFERADDAAFPLMNSVHSHSHQSKQRKLGSRWPTFPEFVEFLLTEAKHGASLDMHWTPITNFCTPCQVKFDVIIKFETLDDDQRYLIEKAGLNKVGIRPEHKNPGKGKHTNETLRNSFAELSKLQVKGLYEIFKYDFEIFDYSPEPFLKIARDDTSAEIRESRKELNIDKSKVLPFS